ncbi:MAG: transposase [Francisellaceae bacterium]|nr:transposase [Francisellaceae bacterium]
MKLIQNLYEFFLSFFPFKSSPIKKTEKILKEEESFKNKNDPNPYSPEGKLKEVIARLHALRKLLKNPRESNLDQRFLKISQFLGLEESHETLRQDRWQPEITCPYCASNEIMKIASHNFNIASYYHYQCQVCGAEFNDSTGSPFEKGVPPLQVWMQCWYLMACTNSINYISSKLQLDRVTVEQMMAHLQKFFQADKPLDKLENVEQSAEKTGFNTIQNKEDILKQYQRLNADTSTQPVDTAEHRRQQRIRRNPKGGTKPPGSKF